MTIEDAWVADTRNELIELRGKRPGWGYRNHSAVASEPTALGALALLATSNRDESNEIAQEAAGWLAKIQRPDGSIGLSESVGWPGWTTPYAMLLWSALGLWKTEHARAVTWLDGLEGTTVSALDNLDRVSGHDTTLIGWPWVNNTHSWIEPTSLAVLALTHEQGPRTKARVKEALTLIRDRAVKTGGWNYGNKAVFGRGLRAQPGPTGIALLALSKQGPSTQIIQGAIHYLNEILPTTRASAALGWGLLGLRAWGVEPSGASQWLAESHESVKGKPDAPLKLAYLLLAASAKPLDLFQRGDDRTNKDKTVAAEKEGASR